MNLFTTKSNIQHNIKNSLLVMSPKCRFSWLNIAEIRPPANRSGNIVQYNRLHFKNTAVSRVSKMTLCTAQKFVKSKYLQNS